MRDNKNYSVSELAGDRQLWEEYIDPNDQAPFESMSYEDRKNLIIEIWPHDFDDKGDPVE